MPNLSREAEKALLGLRDRFEPLYYLGKNSFEVIFRPLTLKEFKLYTSMGDSYLPCEVNNFISQKAVLFATGGVAELVTVAPAGLVDELVERILNVSGFSGGFDFFTESLLEEREKIFSAEGKIELFICSAFPGTKPKDVQNMNFATQMKLVAMAEMMLGRPFLEEEKKSRRPSDKARQLDPAAEAILSAANADTPDIRSDNAHLNQFITGRERMGM